MGFCPKEVFLKDFSIKGRGGGGGHSGQNKKKEAKYFFKVYSYPSTPFRIR